MSLNQKKSHGIIYPSIDGLVGMIQVAKADPADEETARWPARPPTTSPPARCAS
jgi:hypothetical protein